MTRSILAALVLILAGATAAPAQELRIGMAGDPATLDPVQSVSYVDRVALVGICDRLVDVDEHLAVVPQLATAWSWAADGLALTMKLRPGVVFQDGEPFDAQAVRFNIERAKTASYSRRKSELAPVKDVSVVDPLTVRFDLSEPYAPLLAQFTDRAGMMVSPKAARELGERLGGRPVCAGPYRLVEWVRQDRIVLERFERYWDADHTRIPRVTYQPVPDDAVRLANLLSGGMQLIERVAPTDAATVAGDRRVRLYESPSIGYRALSINLGGEGGKGPSFPRTSPRCRAARSTMPRIPCRRATSPAPRRSWRRAGSPACPSSSWWPTSRSTRASPRSCRPWPARPASTSRSRCSKAVLRSRGSSPAPSRWRW
jgi:peptide/nickel transport system substrate-binding protein